MALGVNVQRMLLLALACTHDSRPDVVLILIDTVRADAMHYAGHPLQATPNIDAFVEQDGTWFSRSYAATSWTLPSTVTLLTGLQPWEHRVVKSQMGTDHYGRLLPHVPTLASRWRGQGYRTGAWINNAFLAPQFGLKEGFDVYSYQGAELTGHRTARETVDEAIAFLGESDDPAFLFVHIMEPHADYDPGEPFKGSFTEGMPHTVTYPLGEEAHVGWMVGMSRPSTDDAAYVRNMYMEEILASDAAVGELLDALRERPAWDESVVVISSDHGEEFWDYGRYEHGHTLLEPVLHVPLAIKAPGIKPSRNDSVVGAEEVHEFLVTPGTGVLADLAIQGTQAGRSQCHQGIIYGPQQAGVVTDSEHLIAQLEPERRFYLFDLDPSARENTPPKAEVDETHPLVQQLVSCRGLDVTIPVDPSPINDPKTFGQLRALGYVD